MSNEPKSELARYAFGYSNRKPGLTFWLIVGFMAAIDVAVLWMAAHQ